MKRNLFLFLLIALLYSCGNNEKSKIDNQDSTIEFTDYYNRKVEVKVSLSSIISLSPGITEILFDLGVGDRVIGRTNFCNYPAEVKNIESVGGITDANLEKIISLRPEIVITSSMVRKDMVDNINKAGISVICLPERSNIEGVYQTLSILGKIFDKKDKSDSLIKNMQNGLDEIKKSYQTNKTKPTIYYVVGYGATGDFTAGKNTYINEIINLAGGENIANNITNWSYSKEELFAKNPDYIIVRQEDLNNFINTSPYKDLKAVKNKKVLGIDSSLMDCQTTRSIEAVKIIAKFINEN